jgi:hypothetical protein
MNGTECAPKATATVRGIKRPSIEIMSLAVNPLLTFTPELSTMMGVLTSTTSHCTKPVPDVDLHSVFVPQNTNFRPMRQPGFRITPAWQRADLAASRPEAKHGKILTRHCIHFRSQLS